MPHVVEPETGIGLVAGDMLLSGAEDELSSQWPDCLDERPRAFRVLSALWRAMRMAADAIEADLILVDVGPNLGALNRAALVTADHVVVPLAPDLYSIQGLRNLGPTLRRWRREWSERVQRNPVASLDVPGGEMMPIGYVVMQHAVRLNRPVKAYERWMDRIPDAYSPNSFLSEDLRRTRHSSMTTPIVSRLSSTFGSLMPLAQEARKPMFTLRPADGAIGGHANAVQACYRDFRALARKIARAMRMWPSRSFAGLRSLATNGDAAVDGGAEELLESVGGFEVEGGDLGVAPDAALPTPLG